MLGVADHEAPDADLGLDVEELGRDAEQEARPGQEAGDGLAGGQGRVGLVVGSRAEAGLVRELHVEGHQGRPRPAPAAGR